MAQSILIFDFGTNEEAAQQARHKIDAWTQGGRLGKKILLKFDREEVAASDDTVSDGSHTTEGAAAASKADSPKGKKKSTGARAKKQETEENGEVAGKVQLLVRLNFSDHEKLTSQRWLDRFSTEEPFKSAKGESVRHGEASFAEKAERFDSLA